MSESLEGGIAKRSHFEDGVDTKHDPKGPALQTIAEFLGMTPDFILNGPLGGPSSLGEVAVFGVENSAQLKPNQRLARAMLGLEAAVTTLRQENPPIEHGEEVRAEWSVLDGETGILTTKKFYCGKTGSDFGTDLSCHFNFDIDEQPRNGSYLHVTLPSNHYLRNTLRLGDPHEPVFFASEPDVYSPEWSTKQEEWLENGGKAKRFFETSRADDQYFRHKPIGGAFFSPDMVTYTPLYDRYAATGIEKYVEITQKLLKMYLQALSERAAK